MLVGDLDEDVVIQLNSDVEFLKLNEDLQRMIQEEMLKSVKWKINTNPEAINKMSRLKELINAAQKNKSDEDRKIMADINDYIKNYSDLTFEEYKQLKKSK
jgi:tRNA(Phe) wybutosine-synthesizing methylase Tyw3